MTDPTTFLLLYAVLPLWLLAGLADWFCHRASAIEHTSGAKESALHLLMFAEVAVPLLACLFLEINALVFLVMILGFAAHEATTFWDLTYASARRTITPLEQHVHSFLEVLPLAAGLLVATLHWGQLLALFGLGDEAARFTLAWKEPPLPAGYVVAIIGLAFLLDLVPFLEEFWRGKRERDNSKVTSPASPRNT